VGSTFALLALFFSDRAPYSNRWRVMMPLGKFAAVLERVSRDGILQTFHGKIRPDEDPVRAADQSLCFTARFRLGFP
jgi:hypothetical protein